MYIYIVTEDNIYAYSPGGVLFIALNSRVADPVGVDLDPVPSIKKNRTDPTFEKTGPETEPPGKKI